MQDTISRGGDSPAIANTLSDKTILITGAAHRIGAQTARTLHRHGANVMIHFRHSAAGATDLYRELNNIRQGSAELVQSDLHDTASLPGVIDAAIEAFGRLDVLINNASSFYATALGETTEQHWHDLMGSNLKAPFFLAQAAAAHLKQQKGCIINIVDIHAERPLKGYPVYSMAKAGLVMLTKSLACELGPDVRVNAIAPGAILWPEHEMDEDTKSKIISRTFLKQQGNPQNIADAIVFLIANAPYTTGQVLNVDGGRSLNS